MDAQPIQKPVTHNGTVPRPPVDGKLPTAKPCTPIDRVNINAKQHTEIDVIDMHIHPAMSQQLFRRDIRKGLAWRTWFPEPERASFQQMKAGNYAAFLSVLYVPERDLLRDFPMMNLLRLFRSQTWHSLIDRDPFETLISMMDAIEKAAQNSLLEARVQLVRSAAELEDVLSLPSDVRPMAMVHCVEGAHVFNSQSASFWDAKREARRRVKQLADRGVAYITLAHFYPNQIVNPCFPFPAKFSRLAHTLSRLREKAGQEDAVERQLWRDLSLGLNELGETVVKAMIEQGMIIDLSHCTPVARKQVMDLCDHHGRRNGVVMSHVGVYAINPSPYNPTQQEIKWIAKHGGVIGVILMNYWLMPAENPQSLDAVASTIDYLIQQGGEDCVSLGTDFDGFTEPPDDLPCSSKIQRIVERLRSMNYRESRIRKIMGGNARRVLREGWGQKMTL